MADGQRAAHFREHIFGEDVCHGAHVFMRTRGEAVRRDNSRRFLPAMLQRVQSQVREFLCFRMGKDRHHAALVMKFVRSQQFSSRRFDVSSELWPQAQNALYVPQCPLWCSF